jgi:hypothetical protein
MGSIVDRGREHLGMSDRAVIAIRRYLLDILRDFEAGKTLDSFVADPAHNSFRHADALHAEIEGSDWRAAFPHLTVRRP